MLQTRPHLCANRDTTQTAFYHLSLKTGWFMPALRKSGSPVAGRRTAKELQNSSTNRCLASFVANNVTGLKALYLQQLSVSSARQRMKHNSAIVNWTCSRLCGSRTPDDFEVEQENVVPIESAHLQLHSGYVEVTQRLLTLNSDQCRHGTDSVSRRSGRITQP